PVWRRPHESMLREGPRVIPRASGAPRQRMRRDTLDGSRYQEETPMSEPPATLRYGERELELPAIVGTEGERALDISKLRAQTGYVTLDTGFVNTASCESAITFIDGEAGILRYRG